VVRCSVGSHHQHWEKVSELAHHKVGSGWLEDGVKKKKKRVWTGEKPVEMGLGYETLLLRPGRNESKVGPVPL
jgi:hypothetical protein